MVQTDFFKSINSLKLIEKEEEATVLDLEEQTQEWEVIQKTQHSQRDSSKLT